MPAAYEGYRPLSTPDTSLPAPDLVPAATNAHGPHPLSVVAGPRPDAMVPMLVVPGRVPVPSPLTERITLAATRAMAREQQQRTRENPPLP
jgi:hypothetical protein